MHIFRHSFRVQTYFLIRNVSVHNRSSTPIVSISAVDLQYGSFRMLPKRRLLHSRKRISDFPVVILSYIFITMWSFFCLEIMPKCEQTLDNVWNSLPERPSGIIDHLVCCSFFATIKLVPERSQENHMHIVCGQSGSVDNRTRRWIDCYCLCMSCDYSTIARV